MQKKKHYFYHQITIEFEYQIRTRPDIYYKIYIRVLPIEMCLKYACVYKNIEKFVVNNMNWPN